MKEIEIDGSLNEGGGQILRTAIGLGALLGKKITVNNIRANRPKPGLAKQHMTGLIALKEITGAKVQGLKVGSTKVVFEPGKIKEKIDLTISIGTAGSISLVIQQLLPLTLKSEIGLKIRGGTHVPFSPSITFMGKVLFPELKKMNLGLSIELLQIGYYPKGNGRVMFKSKNPNLPLKLINLVEKGNLLKVNAFSYSSGMLALISRNQLISAKKKIKEFDKEIEIREELKSMPDRKDTKGSSLDLIAEYGLCRLAGNSIGKQGEEAVKVGNNSAKLLLGQIENGNPCDYHLADQLIPFMALAEGTSVIKTTKLTKHVLTNIEITEKLLGVKFEVKGKLSEPAEITVKGVGFT